MFLFFFRLRFSDNLSYVDTSTVFVSCKHFNVLSSRSPKIKRCSFPEQSCPFHPIYVKSRLIYKCVSLSWFALQLSDHYLSICCLIRPEIFHILWLKALYGSWTSTAHVPLRRMALYRSWPILIYFYGPRPYMAHGPLQLTALYGSWPSIAHGPLLLMARVDIIYYI